MISSFSLLLDFLKKFIECQYVEYVLLTDNEISLTDDLF